jgi:hypothetical protein
MFEQRSKRGLLKEGNLLCALISKGKVHDNHEQICLQSKQVHEHDQFVGFDVPSNFNWRQKQDFQV